MCGLIEEIALTYISSVSHRSAACASPRLGSHCDGCCSDSCCHDVPFFDDLNLWIFSGAHETRGLSALSTCSCRGYVVGGWWGLWSSLVERGCGTRVSRSSRHLVFGSTLTRVKTDSHVRFTTVFLSLPPAIDNSLKNPSLLINFAYFDCLYQDLSRFSPNLMILCLLINMHFV